MYYTPGESKSHQLLQVPGAQWKHKPSSALGAHCFWNSFDHEIQYYFFSVYDEGHFLRKVIVCSHCSALIFRDFPCKGKQAKVLGVLKEKKKIKFSANSNYRDRSQGWVVHFSHTEELSHMILWVAVHLSIFPAISAEVSLNYAELGCLPPSSFIIKLPAVSMKGPH